MRTGKGAPAGARAVTVLAVLGTLLGLAGITRAAEFGVLRSGPPQVLPPGYFMLVGPDTVQPNLVWAFGDIPHVMTFYIEVTTRSRLTINLFDPGLYNPIPPGGMGVQLDSSLSPTGYVGEMRFTLISPTLGQLQQTSYGADTLATNRQLVQFYNRNNVGAGTYQLVCEILATSGKDEDISVFGLQVPDHSVYTYNLSVGHNRMGDADIAEPIVLYPWVDYSFPGTESGRPVCGLDFVNYDMDSVPSGGTPPPDLAITTARGFRFDQPLPSGNMSFWTDRMASVPFGELDSDDQGVWRWDFWDVRVVEDWPSPSLPNPYNLNAFSVQVYDYGQTSPVWQDWPYQPSFLRPIEDRHPRRLYLPDDGNAAPRKESMGHSARVIAGQDPPVVGMASTLEVTFRFQNPREYDINVVSGTTYVNPDPAYSNPRITASGTNLQAAIDGVDSKRINITGQVRAGTTESFRYAVDVTPTAVGLSFVTGDGLDFTGGANRQTVVEYTTPITMLYGNDRFGPICGIYLNARDNKCTAEAVVSASAPAVCPGGTVTLNSTGSRVILCPGGNIEYRWREAGSVIRPWPAPASIDVSPTAPTTYTLEVRCSSEPTTCMASKDIQVDVYPAPAPVLEPPSPSVCAGVSINLDLMNPGDYASFVWATTPPGHPGDGSRNPSVTVGFPQVGVKYTLTGTTGQGCVRTGEVTVAERIPTPPVFSPADPAICPGRSVRIDAQGPFTRCVWTTQPPGAPGDGTTPDCFVTATQANVQYTVTAYDADGCSSTASVTTRTASDTIPPALGNVLFLTRENRNDIRVRWTDLSQPVGEYRIPRVDADRDLDGVKDTNPTLPAIDAAPFDTVAPAVETLLRTGGVLSPSFLVYYRVRAASECTRTAGPP